MPTIFFDFDSTVCTKESLDEVIALALNDHPEKASLVAEVEAITNRGMSGKLDFIESVKARLEVCPLERRHFELIGEQLSNCLTSGMDDLFVWLNENNWSVYLISGGFKPSILPAAKSLGLSEDQVFTNDICCNDGDQVVGVDEKSWLWTNDGKAPVINFLRDQKNLSGPFVLVGDGANDLAAFTAGAVDYFIGFGANVVREKIKTQSPNFAYNTEEIKTFLQNLS